MDDKQVGEEYILEMVAHRQDTLYRFQASFSTIITNDGKIISPPGCCTKGYYEQHTGFIWDELPPLPDYLRKEIYL